MALTNKGNFIITYNNVSTEYSPKSLVVSYETLTSEESGRADSGDMHIIFKSKTVRSVNIEMPITQNTTKMQTLLSSIRGHQYQITFFDISSNAEVTMNAFTTNSAAECYTGARGTNGTWAGIAFVAKEV